MASGDLLNSQANSLPVPRIKLLTMFRLGLFQMGLSMMSVLTLGVLNRVMIQELAIPATIVAAILALNLFVSPARIWFGQISDTKPIFGYHRTGYVWLGAAVFGIFSFLAVQVTWQLGGSLQAQGWNTQTYGWIALLALVFALFGLATSASSTAFGALLVDVSEEDNRSKLVSIVWSMLMVGIIAGAIISGSSLKQSGTDVPLGGLQASVNKLFIIVPAIVFGLALLGVVGVEKKYSRYSTRSTLVDREDKITLGKALKVLTASPQTGVFFTFLVAVVFGLSMQDPVLEPYGGSVFNMPLAETTKLNAYWGIGTLIGLSLTGFFIVPRFGKRRTTRIGCVLVAITTVLVSISGFSGNPAFLKFVLVLFGLASGVVTTGSISLMLDLTAAETAGTFIGAWGLAQAMARGIAVVAGGIVLDLGKTVFTTPVLAYGFVFWLEASAMILAIWFLNRVDVTEFRTTAKQAIASVLESELD